MRRAALERTVGKVVLLLLDRRLLLHGKCAQLGAQLGGVPQAQRSYAELARREGAGAPQLLVQLGVRTAVVVLDKGPLPDTPSHVRVHGGSAPQRVELALVDFFSGQSRRICSRWNIRCLRSLRNLGDARSQRLVLQRLVFQIIRRRRSREPLHQALLGMRSNTAVGDRRVAVSTDDGPRHRARQD